MATPATTPQADQGATPGAGAAPAGQQQANPLQQALAKLAQLMDQMGQQNPVVQGELQEAKSALVKALQKTMMAARPQEAQPGQGQQPGG